MSNKRHILTPQQSLLAQTTRTKSSTGNRSDNWEVVKTISNYLWKHAYHEIGRRQKHVFANSYEIGCERAVVRREEAEMKDLAMKACLTDCCASLTPRQYVRQFPCEFIETQKLMMISNYVQQPSSSHVTLIIGLPMWS